MDFHFEDDRLSPSFDVWRELAAEPLWSRSSPEIAFVPAAAPVAEELAVFAPRPGLGTRIKRLAVAVALSPIPSVALVSLLLQAARSA